MGMQSGGDIDWQSYEKEVDPEVLKMFKDSFSCKSPHTAYGVAGKQQSKTGIGNAALDFPEYDASALATEAESKLDGIIKQVCMARHSAHTLVWTAPIANDICRLRN